ncbi:MAG TPA: hypothetical protein VM370_00535 [Candidatus Thermoplasmatota archaeon]|nr:hypothetical protein [Candidatus Thermoplasmatota archaeon]
MHVRPLLAPIVALALLTVSLSGCLQADSDGPPLISRVHTLTVDRASMAAAEEHDDDAQAALMELLTTDLVVRVESAGDYTLRYTDASGSAQSVALTGLVPGEPRTVSHVDPLAPATLLRGDAAAATRAGVNTTWWRFGDAALGFSMTPGAKALYTYASRVEESLTLSDIEVGEEDFTLADASFSLKLPLRGTISYDMADFTADGAPLTVAGSFEVPAGAGDLVSVDVQGTKHGEPGTAGALGGVDEARGNASARVWILDGQPVASQFLGGSINVQPRAIAWGDGFFADLAEGQNCAGKTKADRCEPEELEPIDETQEATEKDVFDEDDAPKAGDDAARRAFALMERLFAQDIQPGDRATVVLAMDGEDFGGGAPDAPTGSVRTEFTIEATGVEDVTVPAGTFDALKLVEEVRTTFQIGKLDDPETNEPLLSDFSGNELIARTTYWLDPETYQPLKMQATTPLDLDALLKRMVAAVQPSAWESMGITKPDADQWHVTAMAESSYEAKELAQGARFSALVGLALAHAVTGSLAGAPMNVLGMLPGSFAAPATPVLPYEDGNWTDRSEPISLAIASAGPIEDGVKTYTVVSASKGLHWRDLGVSIDGEPLTEASGEAPCPDDEPCMAEPVCATPGEAEYAVCHEDGMYPWDEVREGDTLAVHAERGSTLTIVDLEANSIVLRLEIN